MQHSVLALMSLPLQLWRSLVQPSAAQWVVCGILLVLMTLLELGGDAMRLQLRYESPLVSSGEWYRLLTGHFVHLGINHLALNLTGMVLFFYLFVKTISALEILTTIVLYALFISFAMHLSGDIYWYVGFSGVLYGLFVFGVFRDALASLAAKCLVVCVIVAKVLYDLASGGDPALEEFTGGAVITQAHLYGIVIALTHCAVRWFYVNKMNNKNNTQKGYSHD